MTCYHHCSHGLVTVCHVSIPFLWPYVQVSCNGGSRTWFVWHYREVLFPHSRKEKAGRCSPRRLSRPLGALRHPVQLPGAMSKRNYRQMIRRSRNPENNQGRCRPGRYHDTASSSSPNPPTAIRISCSASAQLARKVPFLLPWMLHLHHRDHTPTGLIPYIRLREAVKCCSTESGIWASQVDFDEPAGERDAGAARLEHRVTQALPANILRDMEAQLRGIDSDDSW